MRGDEPGQKGMWSYVPLEARIPQDHPLRPIRQMVDRALADMSPEFDRIYSTVGRPSIPPERLLRALLIQMLYTVRSERMLMEQLDYNLLFRWFVGMEMDDPVWVPTVFSKNRDRLLAGDIAQLFFEKVLRQAREKHLLSSEHFTVDGTLIEAWASQKSFQRKDGPKGKPPEGSGSNPSVNFRGEKRTNETHESRTDPDARMYRKGNSVGAILCYMGHLLMENRHGLAVGAVVSQATGRAERESALKLVTRIPGASPITLAADKAYDAREFVGALRQLGATPHIAQNMGPRRSSCIDGRTTSHAGYGISQRKRKLVEQAFGWMKTVGGLRKTKHRGVPRVQWMFTLAMAAYNLVRLRTLTTETG
jgi:transposase